MLNKLLVAIFCLLFIIVILEVGYYFYFTSNTTTSAKIIPTTVPSANGTPPTIPSQLQKIPKDIVVASETANNILNSEYRGKVSRLETTGGSYNNIPYVFYITLAGSQGSSYTFYMSERNINKLKLLNKTTTNPVPMELKDIKIGDEVSIITKADLLEKLDKSLLEITISKI